MAKINKEEYEVLKEVLSEGYEWIARDGINNRLYAYLGKPNKHYKHWKDEELMFEQIDEDLFQFIQWEDEEPYNIQALIDEYESELFKNAKIVNLDASKIVGNASDYKHLYKRVGESEETEVKTLESIREEIWDEMLYLGGKRKTRWADIKYQTLRELLQKLEHLDEPEPKSISLQGVIQRLWELPLNDRKYWLAQLNDEFQEGYVVPLGLKTTDGKEQYLTYNGSYFACRRNSHLQQTFATLEDIPEFYRDLAERVL